MADAANSSTIGPALIFACTPIMFGGISQADDACHEYHRRRERVHPAGAPDQPEARIDKAPDQDKRCKREHPGPDDETDDAYRVVGFIPLSAFSPSAAALAAGVYQFRSAAKMTAANPPPAR